MCMVRKSQSHAPSVKASAGSSRHGGHAKTRDKNITWVSRDDPRRGKTDLAAFAAPPEGEIDVGVGKDPDAVPRDFGWSEAVLLEPPENQSTAIQVLADRMHL